ncbi:phage antirepressor KilAC domain-containing protein [Kocuria rhizophila]|uniref:phage antirepressor KilAC domain-containing protein n=1 Tax=Kocuria rhizophila TaxID=72000 RepID=UPI000362FD2F|nr:phage antirepressor KilAC domain-containing protein [Kocuria rhizophila]
MSSNLMQYEYLGQGVRILEEDGEALFVASDVARVLCHRDAANMLRSLPADTKGTHVVSTPGGEQQLTVITEPGFFRAVMMRETGRMADEGTRDAVRAFQRWVTHEVLPQIRKTGAYAIHQTPQLPKTQDELVLEAMQILSTRVQEAQAKVLELTPKANAWDEYLSAEGDISVNEASKALSRKTAWEIGENGLWALLFTAKWIYRDGRGRPRAYQAQIHRGRLAERGRTFNDPHTGALRHATPQVRVRSKGLEDLRRLLAEQHERKAIA